MTDTRYSAEDLRKMAEPHAKMADEFRVNPSMAPETVEYLDKTVAVFRQAARDAETLAGIRAWLNAMRSGSGVRTAELALAELDRLSRGDAFMRA